MQKAQSDNRINGFVRPPLRLNPGLDASKIPNLSECVFCRIDVTNEKALVNFQATKKLDLLSKLTAPFTTLTFWYSSGNVLASAGVSYIGFVGNLAMGLLGIRNELRGKEKPEKCVDAPTKHSSIFRQWIASPGIVQAVDTAVLGLAIVEMVAASNLVVKSVAFGLFMMGNPASIAITNAKYWRDNNISEPYGGALQRLWNASPSRLQKLLNSPGVWWCAGDIVLGVSELSSGALSSSYSTAIFTASGVAAASIGVCSGLFSVVRNTLSERSTILSAVSYQMFAAANFSVGNFMLGAAFLSWSIFTCLLSRQTGKKTVT